ncbi:helix-turn-helix transcriptional regulator [Paraburkholderia sp. UYCP14C]|uniref:LuxR C-terminal-related transcriptional regulator n=1 Tax=Paraburkholderia sp. UYCP14C TaxID=2511130 RepID=UPI0010213480|nr:LuxR C-terminal-related transcriptional regulator [Paraburkholderia sp. UYCP14C]RZF30204.1 helix-turn-helix transcriptional regulator [Paraburkholderia sp. UYCP14C]
MEASSCRTDGEWSVSLIQTKMIAPRLPSRCVRRLALLNRLDERRPRSVVVVSAPAGFGKTTLLSERTEALSEKGHPVAWLSLDGEDDDPQLFVAYLVAALARVAEDIASQAQRLLSLDSLTPIRTIISVLLNGIAECGRSVFFVLDDVDRVTAKPVLTVISRLLRYAPENMHILVGARAEPALTLGQLRTPEELVRIGADDLRFSIDEAQSFFDRTGAVPLERSNVELLNGTTEGWIAGLQLASLALGQMRDASGIANNLMGPGSGIDRYLNDTVLTHLPPPMLEFLLHTSILERLGPGVCDAILDGEGSGEKLAWLERHNVFIRPLDERHDWYRYHALLSDALRRRLLRQKPQQVQLLHGRACRWFAAERLWPEAVRHALAAGEFELATQWAENCAIDMLERGDPYALLGWINKFPPDVIRGRLRLRLAKAWALAFSLQITSASKEIGSIVDELTRTHSEDAGAVDEAGLAEVNAVAALVAAVGDDSERALEHGRAAEASGAVVAPWVKRYAQSVQFFGLIYRGRFDQILHIWDLVKDRGEADAEPHHSDLYRDAMYGLAAMMHGELTEARRTFEVAMRRAERSLGVSSAGVACIAGYVAYVYYECDELPKARQMIAGRTNIILESAPIGALARHILVAARLLRRAGETGSALAALEDGRQVAMKRQWLRLKLACDAEAVRLFIEDGNVAQARQIADDLSVSVPALCEGRQGSAIESWTNYCMLQARVQMAEGFASKAVVLLERSLDTLAAMGWRVSEALVSLLLACAYEQCGEADRALVILERALHIGGAIGMINSFVDEGQPVRALLQRFRQGSGGTVTPEMAYADRLLAVFDECDSCRSVSTRSVRVVTTSSDVLSVRELEIINCVALGLSNKEIGRSLKLAPETVKWHLKNIFEKLNVSSRIEAVHIVLGRGVGDGRAAM